MVKDVGYGSRGKRFIVGYDTDTANPLVKHCRSENLNTTLIRLPLTTFSMGMGVFKIFLF